ncbi:aminoacyl-tRNA hydrolase [Phormidium tenue]|uniref:Peptidyl-tRNA hydrolase n=1 Tax=Phormidium tenue NIES-30 TaxID=549789 RepID=A0A1U7J8F3_9CYAN|nr:aminoacyl-tRNA hydrolase [Phormidium tenue]MBD2231269.1 aminoacyl-tRNA hydrolase [Phormidium tenue FACHB-1052]OKH49514.1 aminoacyl-tRNA hydrolase [Phormidium tenue NIES-30]
MADAVSPALPCLIVGLGNPGDKYAGTRHNIGFEVIDRLSKSWAVSLKEERRFQGEYGAGFGPTRQKVYLLKPLTYMNRSGQSMRAVLDWLKLEPSQVLVVYDDMDLPVGRLRLRLSGSAGGHNGMKSAIAHLGTQEFPRLRIGIGASDRTGDQAVVSHVLGNFSKAERSTLDGVVDTTLRTIEKALTDGVEKAMSLYNSVDLSGG